MFLRLCTCILLFSFAIPHTYSFPECTSVSVFWATCSGKTTWVFRLFLHKDSLFTKPPEKVLDCYGVYQPMFEQMEREYCTLIFIKVYLLKSN